MNRDLINDLCNYAFDNGIGVEMIQANHDTPSICLKNKRLIVLNLSSNEKQLPFVFAHEIGHIINDDCMEEYNNGYPYYKTKCEHKADVTGLKILLPMYIDKVGYESVFTIPIMEQLGIPMKLLDEVKDISSNLVNC